MIQPTDLTQIFQFYSSVCVCVFNFRHLYPMCSFVYPSLCLDLEQFFYHRGLLCCSFTTEVSYVILL